MLTQATPDTTHPCTLFSLPTDTPPPSLYILYILLLMLPKKGFSAKYNTITNTDLNLN